MAAFRRHLGTLLIAAGLLLAAWPTITWGYGAYWQARLARGWTSGGSARPAQEADGAGAEGTPESDGAASTPVVPFARLKIERIGLDAMVVEGIDGVSLRRGPGHLPDTCDPGDSGNCAIAAHRDGWFRRLEELHQGDLVEVVTPDCQYAYVVDERRVVEPERGDLLKTGDYPTLTLITCTGPGYPHSTQRLLVFCKLKAYQQL